jgi:hypothetical protein
LTSTRTNGTTLSTITNVGGEVNATVTTQSETNDASNLVFFGKAEG